MAHFRNRKISVTVCISDKWSVDEFGWMACDRAITTRKRAREFVCPCELLAVCLRRFVWCQVD